MTDAGRPSPPRERELLTPVDVCDAHGRLNEAAIGWSRRPLQALRFAGPLRQRWPRQKRWQFWAVTNGQHVVTLTIADVDYLGLAVVELIDVAAQTLAQRMAALPFAAGCAVAAEPTGTASARLPSVRAACTPTKRGVRLVARSPAWLPRKARIDLSIDIDRAPDDESLNVVVPFSRTRFQYTSKHPALAARGYASLGGMRAELGSGSFACLDFGRGLWPYRTTWNWAAAGGEQDGRRVGLNLGGQWTDGGDVTENALFLDGRIHKIGERLRFTFDERDPQAPWQIVDVDSQGARVALTLTPHFARRLDVNLVLGRTRLTQAFGEFSGKVIAGEQTQSLMRLFGWAEEHHARW